MPVKWRIWSGYGGSESQATQERRPAELRWLRMRPVPNGRMSSESDPAHPSVVLAEWTQKADEGVRKQRGNG